MSNFIISCPARICCAVDNLDYFFFSLRQLDKLSGSKSPLNRNCDIRDLGIFFVSSEKM